MILCLITDRRRADPVAQARRAAEAGVDFLQVRERDLDAAALAALVARILDAVRGCPTRVIVNDRADVAIACGAHGVHLRSDSIPPAAARRLAPAPWLIGRSVHGVDDARRAERGGADYAIAGTVFETASKAGVDRLLGPGGLRAIAAAVRIPVLAIGGMTLDRVETVAAAGAAGIAAIGLFAGAGSLVALTAALRRRFDSAERPS